jgi:hypothetical protein
MNLKKKGNKYEETLRPVQDTSNFVILPSCIYISVVIPAKFFTKPYVQSHCVLLSSQAPSTMWYLRVHWQRITKQIHQNLQRHKASIKPILVHPSSDIP